MNLASQAESPPANLVVIGASTGGPRVLSDLMGQLPPLNACLISSSISPNSSMLPLSEPLAATHARKFGSPNRVTDWLPDWCW